MKALLDQKMEHVEKTSKPKQAWRKTANLGNMILIPSSSGLGKVLSFLFSILKFELRQTIIIESEDIINDVA